MAAQTVSFDSIEVLYSPMGIVRTSNNALEILTTRPTALFTSVTGAGVSTNCIEVLMAGKSTAITSDYLLEVLVMPASISTGGGTTPITVPVTTGWVTIG